MLGTRLKRHTESARNIADAALEKATNIRPKWRQNRRLEASETALEIAPEAALRRRLILRTNQARNSAATAPKTAFEHVSPGVLTADGRIHFPLPQQFKTGNFETVQKHRSSVTDDHSLTTRLKTTPETAQNSALDIVLDATPKRLRKRRQNSTQNDFTR